MEDGVVDLDVERAFKSCCPCRPGCDRSEFELSHVPRTGGDGLYLPPQAISLSHFLHLEIEAFFKGLGDLTPPDNRDQ